MSDKINFKQLEITNVNERAYGNEFDYSYEYYYDVVLQYGKRKPVTLMKDWNKRSNKAVVLTEEHIAEAIGQPFNAKLRKQLFKENPELFHSISGMHKELKCAAMGGDAARKKVDEAHAKMKQAIQEYETVKSRVEKRRVSVHLQIFEI